MEKRRKQHNADHENLIQLKRKGKQNVRLMVLLFFVCIIIYIVLGYLLLDTMLIHTTYEGKMLQYIFIAVVVMCCWLWSCIGLWQYKKWGRMLFALFTPLSFFTIFYFTKLMQVLIVDVELKILRFLFGALFVGKNILSFMCMIRLYTDRSIRQIWIVEENDEAETNEELSIPFASSLMTAPTLFIDHDSKIAKKAQKTLRKYTVILVLYAYGGMFLIQLLLAYLIMSYSSERIGLEFVQREMMLANLYTAFVWLFPAVCMFLYIRLSKVIVMLVWLLEIARMIVRYPSIFHVFQTQRYHILVMVCFFVIEIVRYVILLRYTLNLYRNPFIKAYWNKKM